MEYQFIKDPISGYCAQVSEGHQLVARWLNEELSVDPIKAHFDELIEQYLSTRQPQRLTGIELDIIVADDEVRFEAHLIHQQVDLSCYQEDQLECEEQGLVAECGLIDLLDLLVGWFDFTRQFDLAEQMKFYRHQLMR